MTKTPTQFARHKATAARSAARVAKASRSRARLEEGVNGMLKRFFWPIDGPMRRPPPTSNPAIV
jgi:hypothetical protein